MTVRVGINGFGRIGRCFVRALRAAEAKDRAGAAGGDIAVVAVNDLVSPEVNAHLLRHDTTQGTFDVPVEVRDGDLVVGGEVIRVLAERDPSQLPWKSLDVDVVVESSGRFTARDDAAAHLAAGATRVVISAPGKNVDATFVVGVNDGDFDPERHHVVSNASCTTNCFVPMVKVLDDAFGITGGLMTTVHAMTNDQNLLDLAHRDLRRARAASVNIVPATTGAARATGEVLTNMVGKLDGSALRVPVTDGSITDLSAVLGGEADAAAVNAAFRRAASEGPLAAVLDYSEEPIVSTDIVGSPASCTFDAPLTLAVPLAAGSSLVKVFGWYDNEWGYANRLVDLVRIVGGSRA